MPAKLMEFQLWHWAVGSVAKCGESSERDNGLCLPFCLRGSCPPALALMPDTSVPARMQLAPFKPLPQCWSSQRVNLSKSLCGVFKRNCLGLQSFFHWLTPCWFLTGSPHRTFQGRKKQWVACILSLMICPVQLLSFLIFYHFYFFCLILLHVFINCHLFQVLPHFPLLLIIDPLLFLSARHGCGTSLFCFFALCASLDGCGF